MNCARSRFQTRELGSLGVYQINILSLSKTDILVFDNSIVHPAMVKSASPNKFFVSTESEKVYDGNSICPLLVGIQSVPFPVELMREPLAVLT